MKLFVSLDAPHRWVRVNGQGAVRRQGVADSLAEVPFKPRSDEVWAVMAGEDVVTAEASVPTRHRRKLVQALPYALEDRLTEDVDRFHFAVLRWQPGQVAVAGIVSRERIAEARAAFEAVGVALRGLVADYQLLPLHPQASVTLAADGGRVCVLRDNGLGASLDAESLALWWASFAVEDATVAVNQVDLGRTLLDAGGEITEWDIGNDFTQWMRHRSRNQPLANLLPQDEERSRGGGVPGLASAFVIALVAVALRIGVDGAELVQLERQQQQLEREIQAVFRQAFPGETRIVNARAQFRQQLRLLSQGSTESGSFEQLLAMVAPAIDPPRVELQELAFRDDSLEVVCAVENFADLDRLRSRFSSAGASVELVGSGALEERVTGRFRLRPEERP